MFKLLIRNTLLLGALTGLSAAVMAHGPGSGGHAHDFPPEQTDWGINAGEEDVDREVVIRMDDDMRFYPDHLTVSEGETLRLVIHNDGQLLHELVLGNQAELDEHAELMEQFPDMEHDAPYMAHVDPGESASIIWTFNRGGRVDFACLLPGHYQAGMVGYIDVEPTTADHHKHH
ncbi:MAG: hypothetical protein EA348_09235 [Pseudomonadaceae bacterium]|nr:MAG: hypothetical protein EA348_09235 [Pseudomonadaceae bacterium]